MVELKGDEIVVTENTEGEDVLQFALAGFTLFGLRTCTYSTLEQWTSKRTSQRFR